jgi:hypothetical protein
MHGKDDYLISVKKMILEKKNWRTQNSQAAQKFKLGIVYK